jgi:hypothetical protein
MYILCVGVGICALRTVTLGSVGETKDYENKCGTKIRMMVEEEWNGYV